ncbi:unnamed protein product [Linum trigynum]|uniref:Alpha 1,4-glycosyltransferase domain-containing protein n=1 Tax=Linum trigynum TaxID=586398 RepID=A0AAV2DPP3_9ROSI
MPNHRLILSNLLSLALLYKFSGIYLNTDVVVQWSLAGLRNSIGAQTFGRNRPLVYRFIVEFARTFDGNKWGHNNDLYLGLRVVERVVDAGDSGFNFTVQSLAVFHPVDWNMILALFHDRGVGFMRGG